MTGKARLVCWKQAAFGGLANAAWRTGYWMQSLGPMLLWFDLSGCRTFRLARFLDWGRPHARAWRLGNERFERPLGVGGYYFVG